MVNITTHEDALVFATKVQRFMDEHGVGIILACCHLNTYPDDTRYCSGHGVYGDGRKFEDCPFKNYCCELHTREVEIDRLTERDIETFNEWT